MFYLGVFVGCLLMLVVVMVAAAVEYRKMKRASGS